MGLDRTIHLEPFIKIPVQYQDYEENVRTCGEHTNTKGDKFCPRCGKEVKTEKIPKKSMVWCHDLIGSERLYQYVEKDTMYLLSNINSKIKINTAENKFSTLTPELMQSMIEEFSIKHENEIKLLGEKLGIPITVEFGFLYDVR